VFQCCDRTFNNHKIIAVENMIGCGVWELDLDSNLGRTYEGSL